MLKEILELERKTDSVDARLDRTDERIEIIRAALIALHGGALHATACTGEGCRLCAMKKLLDQD